MCQGTYFPEFVCQELSRALRSSPRLLAKVSPERLWVELRRILAGPRAALVCSRMARDHVLSAVLHKDVTAASQVLLM
jgi:tRNA nucleotidyltransferase/poly(A) polymerase